MFFTRLFVVIVVSFLLFTGMQHKSSDDEVVLGSIGYKDVDTSANLTTIAFGSCNKIQKPQDIWPFVAANKPDLWIWLGDIVYADTYKIDSLKAMYNQLKKNANYKLLTANTPVIGIYDDHDYGMNDDCKGNPIKKESRQALYDFLDIAPNAPIRKRQGAYQSYTFGKGDQTVKVIILDTRFFRDTLIADTSMNRRYVPNMTGTILGEVQWAWLEKELRGSKANLNILCSSVQILSDNHGFEKWGNFPKERRRMLSLIDTIKPKNLMILSGDRHAAEVTKINLPNLAYPLYDFTSSGLTHTKGNAPEINKFRVGDMVVKKNFGLLKIAWQGTKPTVSMQVRGHGNELFQEILNRF